MKEKLLLAKKAVERKLVEFLSLDYRSLALMRFGMGLTILLDLFERSKSLTAHYSDLGVLPRADLLSTGINRYFVSVHMISGLPVVEAALFVIAAAFAVALMFGYHTKFVTVVSWFLLISLQARNQMVIQGGDIVLRVILFWMIFLPTGKRWSLDRLFGRTAKPEKTTYWGAATLVYITQFCLVYIMSGVLKNGIPWGNGTAVYYALAIEQLIRPMGEWLRTFSGMMTFFTYATVQLEMFGSALFFFPVKTGLFRTIGIILFAALQIGFNLSMRLGLFGMIMIVSSLGLLPSYFWDSCWARVRRFFSTRAKSGLTMYYDTNCGFCYKSVHILKNFLLLRKETLISSSETDASIAALMERENSWVIKNGDGKIFLRFEGFIEVVSHSPLFFWLKYILSLPFISDIGDFCYRKTAQNRLLVCLPDPIETTSTTKAARLKKTTGSLILVFLTFYIIVWNVDPNNKTELLRPISWIGWSTRLDQQFGMFAPMPLVEDGWYVIPGMLQNGREINLFKNGPLLRGKVLSDVSYEKPPNVSRGYYDQRWQKYLMNIAEAGNSKYRAGYGKYICRTWNTTHTGAETLMTFDIKFMIEPTPPPGEAAKPINPVTLWNHHCFDTPKETPPTPPDAPTKY